MHYVSDEYWKNCFSVYTFNDVIAIYSCKYSIFDFSGWTYRCKSNRETIYWKIIYCFFSSFINNSSDIFYYNYVCKRIVKNEGI